MPPDFKLLTPVSREAYLGSSTLNEGYELLCGALFVEGPSRYSTLNRAIIHAIAEIMGPLTVSERWSVLGPNVLNIGYERHRINCDNSPENIAVLVMRETSRVNSYPYAVMTMQLANLPILVEELSNRKSASESNLDHEQSVAEWMRIQTAYHSLIVHEK